MTILESQVDLLIKKDKEIAMLKEKLAKASKTTKPTGVEANFEHLV